MVSTEGDHDTIYKNVGILDDRIRRICEADLECRRFAPVCKLVTIVLINALTFDCCVVPS